MYAHQGFQRWRHWSCTGTYILAYYSEILLKDFSGENKRTYIIFLSTRPFVEQITCHQVMNKEDDTCFTASDEEVFSRYLQFCGIGLRNAQLYEKSQLEVKRNQVKLNIWYKLFINCDVM